MNERRRLILKQLGAAGALCLGGMPLPVAAKPSLTLHGPPVGPSLMLAHLAHQGQLDDQGLTLDFSAYRDPDMLRTGFVSRRWDLACTPSYVAANLNSKGIKVRLMNIMTWGLLYLVSKDPQTSSLTQLASTTIAMPFKADMPDLVFQHLADSEGMTRDKDYRLHYVANPFQGVQLLLAGRVQHAVLPEPSATAALIKGAQQGVHLHRAINLQQSWGDATGAAPRIPQAGMMIAESRLQAMPDLPSQMNRALEDSTRWVLDNPVEAGRLGEAHLGLKSTIIEKSIPHSYFALTPAAQAQAEIERFFSILAKQNPAIIGGKLPDRDFYLG